MGDEALHLAVLRHGVHTFEDYLRLVRALMVDLQRGLVTTERAMELTRHGLPEHLEGIVMPLEVSEAIYGEVLDGIERGELGRDGRVARLMC